MRFNFNIKGGTAQSDENLCETCRYATIVQGHAIAQFRTECAQLKDPLRWPVTNCTSYNDKRRPTLASMKEVAWILEEKKGGTVGFVRSTDFVKRKGWTALYSEDD